MLVGKRVIVCRLTSAVDVLICVTESCHPRVLRGARVPTPRPAMIVVRRCHL